MEKKNHCLKQILHLHDAPSHDAHLHLYDAPSHDAQFGLKCSKLLADKI